MKQNEKPVFMLHLGWQLRIQGSLGSHSQPETPSVLSRHNLMLRNFHVCVLSVFSLTKMLSDHSSGVPGDGDLSPFPPFPLHFPLLPFIYI